MAYSSLGVPGDGSGMADPGDGPMGSYAISDDGLSGIFDSIIKFASGAVSAVPIVGPAIGAGLKAFTQRATSVAVQQVAAVPAVQQAVYQGATGTVSDFFSRNQTPILAGGAVVLGFLLLSRRRRGSPMPMMATNPRRRRRRHRR